MTNEVYFDKERKNREYREPGKVEKIFSRLFTLTFFVTLVAIPFVLDRKGICSIGLFITLLFIIIFCYVNEDIAKKYYDNIHDISRLDYLYYCSTQGIVKFPTHIETVQGLQFCIDNDCLVDVQAIIVKTKDKLTRNNIKYGKIVSSWESFFYYFS